MSTNQRPSTYGAIIPERVRYDKTLMPGAKLLFAEISSFHQTGKQCYATNAYFAELYGVSEKTISRYVQDLVDRGYVKHNYDGVTRFLEILGFAFTSLSTTELRPEHRTSVSNGTGHQSPVPPDTSVHIQYSSYNTQLQEPSLPGVTGTGARSLNGFANPEIEENFDELLTWIMDRKNIRNLPPQTWYQVFIDIAAAGIPVAQFKDYYIWLENLEWREGVVNEKMIRNQVERYVNREQYEKKAKENKNGKTRSTAVTLLNQLRGKNGRDNSQS